MKRTLLPLTTAALLAAGAIGIARADSDRLMPRDIPAAYTQECGSCHTAYSPALLPARSWQRVMASLEKHYGSDASIDAATQQRIGAWLQAHAATGRRAREEPPHDRISRSAWFLREHRGIDDRGWSLPSVRSAANCSVCHPRADRGDFDDDSLIMPPGLDARQRRRWHD